MNPTSATASPTTPAHRRLAWKRHLPYAVGALLLLLLVNGLRPRPVEVETGMVTTGPLTVTVLEEGKTRIRHRHVVSLPVSGFLRRVELRAGASVKKGETVLAVIEAESPSLLNPRALAQAEARVKSAEATRDQREAAMERARATLALAKKDWERADQLRRTGAISGQAWDAAENQAAIAGRDLRAAEFAQQTAEHELAQARAALLQAQSPAPHSAPVEIRAPVDGFVLQVFEESARVLPAGTPILEVGDPADLEAEIELLSSDAVGVHPGAEVQIEQWGGPRPLRARVAVVEPGGYTKVSSLGVEEQRVKVRVDFSEPLPPGVFLGDRYRVEARIVTWHGERVLQVPTGALFRRGGQWQTFLFEGGKARAVPVEIGQNNGVSAEVRTGLAEGQRVLVHAPDVVADGSRVRPRE
jgi:HlyD family secretion protein